MSRGKRTVKLAMSVGIVAILFCAFWLTHPSVVPLESHWPGPRDGAVDRTVSGALANTTETGDEAPAVAESLPASSSAMPAPDPLRRVLLAADVDGQPVAAAFNVMWQVDERRGPGSWAKQTVTTGADGRAELDAPLGKTLRVNSMTAGWVLPWANFKVEGDGMEAPVTVHRTLPLTVQVTYADGQPYTGTLYVDVNFDDRGGWSAPIEMVARPVDSLPFPETVLGLPLPRFHQQVVFAGVPSGAEITFRTAGMRQGYGTARRVVSPQEVQAGFLIEIVIPEGLAPNTPGKIVLVPGEGEILDGKAYVYLVERDGWTLRSSWPLRQRQGQEIVERLESRNVFAGRYVVCIIGKSAWLSEEFEMSPGETKLLYPKILEPAKVRVRVVDAEGVAVAGAVLSAGTRGAPFSIRYNHLDPPLQSSATGEALSDADGVAVLEGFPAGTIKFQVFALGYQPWSAFATLDAGQEYDLGEVRLGRAAGRVEIHLPDWDLAEVTIRWTLEYGDRSDAMAPGVVTSNPFAVEGIPVGQTYRIMLSTPTETGGSRVLHISRPFELTEWSPTHVVDATHLK